MNQYGKQAQRHWQKWFPDRYRAITDPELFFTELGQSAATRITELQTELAGPDLPGESYLQKVGRLNSAKMQAEEIVLTEEVFPVPPPAPTPSPDPRWQPIEAVEMDPEIEQEVRRFIP